MPKRTLSARVYRWLLHLYPARFREEYAGVMEREFRDEAAEAKGFRADVLLWMRMLADLLTSIPTQIAREIWEDAKHTFRLWSKKPMQTSLAISSLAVGIGGTVGIFAVVNALLLRPLPFYQPSRLAALENFLPPDDSARQFHDWANRSTYLSGAAVYEEGDFNLGNESRVDRAHAVQASYNFFSLLGVKTVIGPGFRPGDDVQGRDRIAVISYGLWQQLYAGEQGVLGATIRIDGQPLTIVGVAPPDFSFPKGTVIWKAGGFSPGNQGWNTVARLREGITWREAQARFFADVSRLPAYMGKLTKLKHLPTVRPVQSELAGQTGKTSLLCMVGVGLVLLIACTNIANLLIARTTDRKSELSIRSALGASRARLVQQLMTECLMLGVVAGIFGLVIAVWMTMAEAKIQPPPLATQSYAILDARVLVFALAVSVTTAVLFGILPALRAGSSHQFEFRGSGRSRSSQLVRDALVAAQVVLTIVLLTASISVGRAFYRVVHLHRGFDVRGLVTVGISLDGTRHGIAGRQLPYFEEVLGRVRSLTGVESASATDTLPLYSSGFLGGPLGLDGRPPKMNSIIATVLPNYFRTMGARLLHGRDFTVREVQSKAKVAIVDDVFLDQFGLRGADALGHQVSTSNERPLRIIGVVGSMDHMAQYYSGMPDVHEGEVFVPGVPGGFFSSIVVRVSGSGQDDVAIIRDSIRSLDPTVPVFAAKTMQQRLDQGLARPRFYRSAAILFTAFAWLVTLIGIFASLSYSVTQRISEMGIRLALGTTPRHLRWKLLQHGLLMVVFAAACGSAGAILSGRFLASLVEGASSIDAWTMVTSVAGITVTAWVSIWIGTRPIARLNVSEILRIE
jgi:putative ABC transport system permease protein